MATFLVEVGIGNFPTRTPKYVPYFLGFDTGSDTIWTQCEGCNRTGHCFHQFLGVQPTVRDIVFGCATDCIGFGRYDRIPGNRLAGIMGAAWGSSSIIGQLHEKRVISGSFSYCMPAFGQDIGAPPSTFLRFGDDIPRRQGMSTTSLVEYRGESHYYVNLVGIIPREVFVRRGHNTGTIIDSGAD
ncbi:aspartic proteinase nepenthesin-2-like [Pyrus communis]|uniref:aspartic proteinase nepenthesin-2-like n=1 Tax=Pyrus communis TaxID=23211 RepID=UPI0035C22F25